MGEKPRNIQKQVKKFSVYLPSNPRFYDMDADCFQVSENTKSKPDLP